jgi:hypothetical protein
LSHSILKPLLIYPLLREAINLDPKVDRDYKITQLKAQITVLQKKLEQSDLNASKPKPRPGSPKLTNKMKMIIL